MSGVALPKALRGRTFAAQDSCSDWFFAVPFAAITGFEEVAEAARSLATLPVGLDLDHFVCTDEDSGLGRRRRRLLAAPDMERASFLERRRAANRMLRRRVQRVRAARERVKAGEERYEWQWCIGPTNYSYGPSAPPTAASGVFSPRIAPLRRSMERFFGGDCPCVGDQFYPPGAFRDWHTNRFDHVGWVVFLVEVAEPGRSSFRYLDPRTGELVVVPDRNEVAYFFRTSAEEPLFWHGVLCEDTFRWSQGFSIPQDWRSRLVSRAGTNVGGEEVDADPPLLVQRIADPGP